MTQLNIKMLKDNKGNSFLPFSTTDSVFEADSDKTLADILAEQANAISEVAADIPTNVSDLTNDAGYIDKDVNDLTNYTTTTDLNTALSDKVDKVSGKQLSTEDYTTDEKNKLAGIEASADVNTIESISVNNSTITPDVNKNIDITVPTKVSDLNNDSGFITGINSTDVTIALGFTPMDSALKGVNSGVAELDATGKVPSSQLPSYVDDVLEYASLSQFPATGETGKIYITKDTNKTYRWSGSAYVEISESLALGETSSTAYRGDRGKTAYDHSQAAHAPSNAEHNTIETISLNGTALTPDANRNINISVNASGVSYDNTITGFVSTNMQDVFDEFVGEFNNDYYHTKKLPLLYYEDPDEPEEYNSYYNHVVNVESISGAGIANGTYIVDETVCTLAHPGGIDIKFGNAPSSIYQAEYFQLKHGDIVIVNCASDSAYTVGDRVTVIREGKIYTSTVTSVAGSGKRTKLKTEHSLSEVPHHLTNATISHNDFRDDYTHVADVDTVGECFVDGGTLQNLTFPAGTLFYVNWDTINSIPGIIITPTGIIYKATAMSFRGFTLITINSPVDVSNYLAKDNTTAFTPTGDYNPATKKYVDDNADVTLITEDTDLLTLNNGIYRVDAPYTNAYLYIPIAQNFVLSEAIDRTNTSSVGKYIRVEQGLVILNDGLYGGDKYYTATLIPTTEMAYTEKISGGTKTADTSYNNILKLDKTDRRATYFDSMQEYITDETLPDIVKQLIDTYAIHRITQSAGTASTKFSGGLSINDIDITLSCNFDGAGTYTNVTFPAGTLFFINYTKTALGTPGIIIMSDGTMYKITSISASGSLVGVTISPKSSDSEPFIKVKAFVMSLPATTTGYTDGDLVYDMNTNKIYTVSNAAWDTGVAPETGKYYLLTDDTYDATSGYLVTRGVYYIGENDGGYPASRLSVATGWDTSEVGSATIFIAAKTGCSMNHRGDSFVYPTKTGFGQTDVTIILPKMSTINIFKKDNSTISVGDMFNIITNNTIYLGECTNIQTSGSGAFEHTDYTWSVTTKTIGFDYTSITGYSQSTANQFLTHDTNGNLMWATIPVAAQSTIGGVKAYADANNDLYISTQ